MQEEEWLDLTQTIENNMMVYPGDPSVQLTAALTYEKDHCQVSRICFGSHTGTHMDAPRHFFPGGKKIGDFPPGKFMGRGIVIDAGSRQPEEIIGPEIFIPHEEMLIPGTILLLRTGWSKYFGQKVYFRQPHLSLPALHYLAARNIALLGMDTPGIDDVVTGSCEGHKFLLAREILLVENLTKLEALTAGEPYFFSLLPLKLDVGDGSPLRAVAKKILPPGRPGYDQ